MTPPDRAPEPLTEWGRAFAEALLNSPFTPDPYNVTIPSSLLRSLLDAARDSRPVGGHTWAEHVACDPATCTVAHLARDSRPVGEGLWEALRSQMDRRNAVLDEHDEGHRDADDMELTFYLRAGDVRAALQAGPAAVRPVERERLTCTKCGGTDIVTAWHGSLLTCGWHDRGFSGEHLHRSCRTCGWPWADKPLDAALSTTQPASTEKPR